MAGKKVIPLEAGNYGLVKAFKGPHKGKVFDYDDDEGEYAICYENDAFSDAVSNEPHCLIPHSQLTPYLRHFLKMLEPSPN